MRSRTSAGTNDEDLKRKISLAGVRRLLGLSLPHWRILLVSGFLALIAAGVQLALPVLVRGAANQVQQSGDVAQLDRVALGLLGLLVVSGLIGVGQFLLSAYAGNRIVNDLRLRLIAHLQRLPVAYFDRHRSGDLTSLLSNDVAQLQTTLTDDLVHFPSNIVMMVGLIGVAIYMNWRLTLVVVTVLAAMMVFFVVTGRALRQINRKALEAVADTLGAVTEVLANIRLVKAFAREGYEDERARNRLADVFGLSMKGARWEAVMAAVGTIGAMLMAIGVMWYGVRGVMSGIFRIGDVIGFVVVVMFLAGPMGSLASLYTRLQRASGAADRIFAILDEPAEAADAPAAIAYPDGPGEVVFDSIRFSYVLGTPVLRSLSLRLPPGQVTAIVGPSGAGKTTLSSLIYRFYDPQGGQILIDGIPIDQIRRQDLRDHVGIVPQDPILFNGTLRENIRYGRLGASDEEVRQSAIEANVDEFARSLPDGYDTVIGERGVTLSGGQRQRVAIARVLLKNPRLLILDEATSALDNVSEALVKEALDRLMEGRTTLVIAHRLSTIQDAHQIAVLVDGEVAESGRHEDLLSRQGPYAELYSAAKSQMESDFSHLVSPG